MKKVNQIKKKYSEDITDITNYRIFICEEEIWELRDDEPKHYITQFDKKKDIIFTNDNQAHVTDRMGALTWHGSNSYFFQNTDKVKFVYAGMEDEFLTMEDYQKLLKGVYKGVRTRTKPLEI